MNGDNEVVKGPWAPTPWNDPVPEDDTEGERESQIRRYWAKIRQALKTGNLTLAAESLDSAGA